MMSDDDKDLSLRRLKEDHDASIVSQLVRIGSKRNQQNHEKFLDFIRNLQCLKHQGLELHRCENNAVAERLYVALSYTWAPSSFEDQEPGKYVVEGWDNENLELSPVRACVLDRALRYMNHKGISLLWIDAHCIRQDTCGVDDCVSHPQCDEKRNAVQAMDLVYQLSMDPVALLGRPLKDKSELTLLEQILSGELVGRDDKLRIPPTLIGVAMTALRLLFEITQDSWWQRAWTFQENYRAGIRMNLLIRHDESLESQKQQLKVFGDIPGELCIQSSKFSEQVTRLCQALEGLRGPAKLLAENVKQVNAVLLATGKYQLLINSSSSMTPRVVADIEARGLSKPWDRLAIVANCCQYQVRLDSGELSRTGQSLSLSVLAMCLLNGEILNNREAISVAHMTPSKCLEELMYTQFMAPKHKKELSYNKGCRLTDVELTADGIVTQGHLWKLGPIINTTNFPRRLPRINEPKGLLKKDDRRCLLQLVYILEETSEYCDLAQQIDEYLQEDAKAAKVAKVAKSAKPAKTGKNSAKAHLHNMAVELVNAIRKRQKLILGSLWHKSGKQESYSAVFVLPDNVLSPAFAFTSMWPAKPGSDGHGANDVDHHVTLEVKKEHQHSSGKPKLRVGSWMPGMCFFYGCRRKEVVFPWPQGLLRV